MVYEAKNIDRSTFIIAEAHGIILSDETELVKEIVCVSTISYCVLSCISSVLIYLAFMRTGMRSTGTVIRFLRKNARRGHHWERGKGTNTAESAKTETSFIVVLFFNSAAKIS